MKYIFHFILTPQLPLSWEVTAHLILIWTPGSAVYCGDCKTFCPVLCIHQSPQAGAALADLQAKLAPLLISVKMFHSQCYLVATVIHIQFLHGQISIYTVYTYSSQYRDASQAKEVKKIGQQ
jgi:hypothetical protein